MKLVHVLPHQLAPWVPQLRALEADITYPLADGQDAFVISHGAQYFPFFSALGDAHFVLAFEGTRVIGCMVAVRKRIEGPRGPTSAVYLGDLKVHRAWRGRGVPARMFLFALREWSSAPRALGWRLAFGAAMRGARGDVMRAARGLMRLGRPMARLEVYFVEPRQLAVLEPKLAPPTPRTAGLDLSPEVTDDLRETRGSKDFVLRTTQLPWPIVHLPRGPRGWGDSHAAYLQRAGAQLVHAGAVGPACFGLDSRLTAEREFLLRSGLTPGATCTVYGFSTTRKTRNAAWVHLATSEI